MADARVVLVTGGGRGIGRASALALADIGFDVAVASRSLDELEAVATEVRHRGRRAVAVQCDVQGYDACAAAVERTVAELGRLDVLVNSAGGGEHRAAVLDSDPGKWAHVIATNLLGVYYCSRAALSHLIAGGGGKIIIIGSGMGHAPSPNNSAYKVAKAGTWMFTRVLSQEVWQHGIDVNEVVPGPVLTRLTEDRFLPGQPPPFAPSERVKLPEEVGEMVAWLAMRPAGGPTGQSFSLARRPL
jgi:3-oxoacyl-[acyl-carrier protein] reductase